MIIKKKYNGTFHLKKIIFTNLTNNGWQIKTYSMLSEKSSYLFLVSP